MAKLHGETVPARRTLPTIGGRAHPAEIELIDTAARKAGEKRGIFLVKAAVERAKRELHVSRKDEVVLPPEATANLGKDTAATTDAAAA